MGGLFNDYTLPRKGHRHVPDCDCRRERVPTFEMAPSSGTLRDRRFRFILYRSINESENLMTPVVCNYHGDSSCYIVIAIEKLEA